jgi:tellurite resistance protein
MDQLARLRPAAKKQLLAACVQSIAADGHVSQMEAELLRVFSEMLDCPVPPLLPGQSFVV